MPELLPLFLNLTGRAVLLVGGGRVAAGKLTQLLAVGARVHVVAPEICDEMAAIVAQGAEPERPGLQVTISPRRFAESDLDDVWLVVAAATPQANHDVASLAEPRRLFVNAVDDPPNASAYLSGVVRRDGVTIAISTSGAAPALTALLREALDALLPRELSMWMAQARAERIGWRRDGVPMEARKPRLLCALNDLYDSSASLSTRLGSGQAPRAVAGQGPGPGQGDEREHLLPAPGPAVPWLSGPEDSWL
jgi:siroheme synthase-like protein